MGKLTEVQRKILAREDRVIYRGGRDQTMCVLAEKGFAVFDSALGEKYGRPHWWITDAGRAAIRGEG